ncbi:GmrSD restriction endonuclease domain-containing protein [Kineococcus sp. SYSU DK004]|uniref:GmrSD restriction endonuclease domain-containing protein n=1 Tax=Kineococcus sp. SYSU DK004 TaxID=3383125 RepID=UPI003D7EF01C
MTSRPRAAALALAAALLAGCAPGGQGGSEGSADPPPPSASSSAPSTSAPVTPAPSTPPPTGEAGDALAVLATLPVKGRAPRAGYDRERFGPAWADVDGNGCDTRNDVLQRDLATFVVRPGSQGCVVASGELRDPYSGRTIAFERGPDTSSAVQVDHVVALSDAWQTGAQAWDTAERTAFANDPLNLLAVDGPLNQAKGDADAATWLPPVRSFRCPYVARQIAVKASYGLWVKPAERDAMAEVLAGCPGEPLPEAGVPPVLDPGAEPPADLDERGPAEPDGPVPDGPDPEVLPPEDQAEAPLPPEPDDEVFFENCAAARAAGAAPLRAGGPGYAARLDRDGDGVACE